MSTHNQAMEHIASAMSNVRLRRSDDVRLLGSSPVIKPLNPPNLPNELWDKVFSFLNLHDIKSVGSPGKSGLPLPREALHHLPYRIKRFKHDQLPVTFFTTQESNYNISLIRPFENLQTLHLTFDATMTPHKVFWKGLGRFPCSLTLIRDLRFGFLPLECGWQDYGTWQDNGNNSLKTGLWQGSIKSLLYTIRDNLHLDSIYIWGLLMGVHTDGESWRLVPWESLWLSESWNDEFWEFAYKNFDKEGYNRHGVHHTRVSVEWQGAVNPIGRATAQRRVLGMIKDRIPRLSGLEIGR
ncbi:hypothetical protein BKA64DRAFT_704483 [Cadophora sp. MPI-SDFR-AT-0126]|nr:hypothetical protein BKA64DRAFT_704483 [Leotiomycetes sp. MPI-SDFR-AT-0126]